MKIALIPLAIPCDSTDLALAIQRTGMEAFDFSWNMSIEQLIDAKGYILLATVPELLRNANIQALGEFLQGQNIKGKPILGLGYAARFMVDYGLVPGLYKHLIGVGIHEKTISPASLMKLSDDYQYNTYTRLLSPKDRLGSPMIAQLEFVIPPGLLAEVQSQGLDVFWFEQGGIAALANKAGNAMAMLAYPENNLNGDALFNSLREHITSDYLAQVEPLCYWPRR